jgi:hypothetical protein
MSHPTLEDAREKYVGKKYGEVVIIDCVERKPSGALVVKVLCSCGVIKNVLLHNLTSGRTTACGHRSPLQKEESYRKQYEHNQHQASRERIDRGVEYSPENEDVDEKSKTAKCAVPSKLATKENREGNPTK